MDKGIVYGKSVFVGTRVFLKNISPLNNRTEMPKALFVIKKLLAFGLCYWAGLLLGEGAVIGLHFACGKNVFRGEMFGFTESTLIQYYGYIIPIAAVLFYWRHIEKRRLREMGITKNIGGWFKGAALGAALLAACVGAVTLTGSIKFAGFAEKPDIPMLVMFFFGFVIQGAYEEILCRGLMLRSLGDKVPFPAALAANTLVFTCPHLGALTEGEPKYVLTGILCLISISCLFTFLTVRTGSIWAACGLHSIWNFGLYCILGLDLSGMDEISVSLINMRAAGESLLNGGKYGIESSIITAAVITAFAAVIAITKERKVG